MLAVGLLVGADSATGEPVNADENTWRGPCFNCYNYAVNKKVDGGGFAYFAQPGGQVNPVTCAKATAQAVADGLTQIAWTPGTAPPDCPTGECLVALTVAPGVDYHWYRLNQDGTWSHKPGQTPARVFKDPVSGNNVTDPATADRGIYTAFCGYFCVPSSPMPDLDNSNPSWARAGSGVRGFKLNGSGKENKETELSTSEVVTRMPTGLPISDPLWSDLTLTDPLFGGYAVLPDLSAGLPSYMRVFQGVVAVYSDLDGTTIDYFNDNNGLEGYLASELATPMVPAVGPVGAVALASLLAGAGAWFARRRTHRR